MNDNLTPDPMTEKTINAFKFAMEQNWNVRVQEWLNLIKPNV